MVLGPYSREHIEELQKTDDGRTFLQEKYTERQIQNLVGEGSLEFDMARAGAVSQNGAIALAATRRSADEIFGGWGTSVRNFAADLLAAAGGQTEVGLVEAMRAPLADLQANNTERNRLIQAYNDATAANVRRRMQRENPDAKISDEEVAEQAGLLPPIYGPFPESPAQKGVSWFDEWLEEAEIRWARPGGSHLAAGFGSVLSSIAVTLLNPRVGFAMMFGANRNEVRNRILADGGSAEDAEMLSTGWGAISTVFEYLNVDRFVKMARGKNPLVDWVKNASLKSGFFEGLEEFEQHLTGGAAVEHSRSLRDADYRFSLLGFLRENAPEGAENFGYGFFIGATTGAALGGPLRATNLQLRRNKHVSFLQDTKEFLKAIPEDLKKSTGSVSRSLRESMQKAGAPTSTYIDAQSFQRFYQNRPNAMCEAMNQLDVSQQQLDTAIEADAQIEVSTEGLAFLSAKQEHATIEEWARPDPEAPTVALLVQERDMERQVAEKLREIQEQNEARPTAIKEFRDQLAKAWNDPEGAQYVADLNYAMASVAGERQGLTAEQYLNLNPIQVFLSRQVARAQEVSSMVQEGERTQLQGEMARAAQNMFKQTAQEQQPGGTPEESLERGKAALQNVLANHVDAPAAMFRQDMGNVSILWGREGNPDREYKGGFGIAHILARRRLDALKRGMSEEQAQQYAQEVTEMMPAVIAYGDVIREYGPEGGERVELNYQGHTATLSKYRDGNRETWLLTGWEDIVPGDAEGVNPNRTYAQAPSGIQGQVGAGTTFTIPAVDGDVKQWGVASVDTILKELGMSGEEAKPFKQFLEAIVGQGDTLVDAQSLYGEFETANMLAEGLDLAARGLERELADPAGITQAVLNNLGIDASTLQEGITEIQKRVADLNSRSNSLREFYKNADVREEVQRTAVGMIPNPGDLADVSFLPDVDVIRAFSGRQTRASMEHELFHVYNDRLVQAAKAPNASPRVIADFNTINEAVGGGLDSADATLRRDAVEKAAVLGERYLAEGQAPSPALAAAFRRFRTWMLNVYRSIQNIGDIELTPEVRGVFDRMIATEQDIAQAREYYHDLEVLAPPADATPEHVADLAEKSERARMSTEERQFKKMLDEFLGGREGRKQIAQEVKADIAVQRQYAAADALRKMGGMSREQAASFIGEAETVKIEKNHKGILKENFKERKDPSEYLPKIALENGDSTVYDLMNAIVTLEADPSVVVKIVHKGGIDELYIQENFGMDAVAAVREGYFGKQHGDKLFSRTNGAAGALLESRRHGYLSVGDMLADIASVPDRRTAERELVKQRIANEEIFVRMAMQQDAATLADEVYHGDALTQALAAKQRILREQAEAQAQREGRAVSRFLSNMALQRIAEDTVGNAASRHAGRYLQYVEAYRRHGIASAKALAAGDKIIANNEYQQMRLNHYLIKEALKAKNFNNSFTRRNTSYREWSRRLEGRRAKSKAPVEERFRNALNDHRLKPVGYSCD